MWFDCVVCETGEPGKHFRANLVQQHLPPSFVEDRRGTAGRGRWQGRREAGLIPALTQALLKRQWHACMLLFYFFLFNLLPVDLNWQSFQLGPIKNDA